MIILARSLSVEQAEIGLAMLTNDVTSPKVVVSRPPQVVISNLETALEAPR